MKPLNAYNALCQMLTARLPQGIALAFSGGVDSSLLLALLAKLQDNVQGTVVAFYFKTPFQSDAETHVAHALATQLHIPFVVIEANTFHLSAVQNNTLQRCYACKRTLFSLLKEQASQRSLATIIEGSHADDLKGYRPGLMALSELGILSPLKICGYTKPMIRALATELQLACAEKASSPCIATRFPYDTPLTPTMVQTALAGETFLRQFIPETVPLRLRITGNTARIEVPPTAFNDILAHRQTILDGLKKLGYATLVLDLNGFHSGGYDQKLHLS